MEKNKVERGLVLGLGMLFLLGWLENNLLIGDFCIEI